MQLSNKKSRVEMRPGAPFATSLTAPISERFALCEALAWKIADARKGAVSALELILGSPGATIG